MGELADLDQALEASDCRTRRGELAIHRPAAALSGPGRLRSVARSDLGTAGYIKPRQVDNPLRSWPESA